MKNYEEIIKDLEAKLARTQNELTAKVEYIQELVEVKDDYKQQLADKDKELEKEYNDGFIWEGKARDAWDDIEKLKQQLAEQPKQIVEKIKEYCWYGGAWLEDNYYKVTDKILDTILKELQGE